MLLNSSIAPARGARDGATSTERLTRFSSDLRHRGLAARELDHYYPFGQEATSPYADAERAKLTGHERDLRDATKTTDDLDYMHARSYNMNVGRFLAPDPVRGDARRPQSFNPYAYVRNNPENLVDPTGLVDEMGTGAVDPSATSGGQQNRAGSQALQASHVTQQANRVNEQAQTATPPPVALVASHTGSDVAAQASEEGTRRADEMAGLEGTPYKTAAGAGSTPEGADCSGAVWLAHVNAGNPYPYATAAGIPSSPFFAHVPGNSPQIGDVGVWVAGPSRAHVMMFDPRIQRDSRGVPVNSWSAFRPGKALGLAHSSWFTKQYGVVPTWYRYQQPPGQ